MPEKRKRRVATCGNCGERGHYKTTCPARLGTSSSSDDRKLASSSGQQLNETMLTHQSISHLDSRARNGSPGPVDSSDDEPDSDLDAADSMRYKWERASSSASNSEEEYEEECSLEDNLSDISSGSGEAVEPSDPFRMVRKIDKKVQQWSREELVPP